MSRFNATFLVLMLVALTPLSEHLTPIGLLVRDRLKGKVIPYCALIAELTK